MELVSVVSTQIAAVSVANATAAIEALDALLNMASHEGWGIEQLRQEVISILFPNSADDLLAYRDAIQYGVSPVL